jgi:hypothetical protein
MIFLIKAIDIVNDQWIAMDVFLEIFLDVYNSRLPMFCDQLTEHLLSVLPYSNKILTHLYLSFE